MLCALSMLGPSLAPLLCSLCIADACPTPSAALPGTPPAAQRPAAERTIVVTNSAPATLSDPGLTIALDSVRDNRCATEVQCVWAGYAEVALRVKAKDGSASPVVIGAVASDGKPTRDATFAGHRFTLEKLEPANSMAKPPKLADYRVTLVVAKE